MSEPYPTTGPLWFLVRLAREFRRGGWIFTGFHWPVVAAQVAWQLPGDPFVEVFEAGAALTSGPPGVPTSTTDYANYHQHLGMVASTNDVLLGLVRRLDRVVLDASNVDVRGRINSTAIGPYGRPSVRLPGGGGAPDAATQARSLVLAVGSADLGRFHDRVEHVTAAPGPQTEVTAITRWGVLQLGEAPRLIERAPGVDDPVFQERMAAIGVAAEGAPWGAPIEPAEAAAALAVLQEAARTEYVAAAALLADVRSAQ